MTTVTISDELRRKLKRLAAKYDTNQAEIIEKSLILLELHENEIDFSSLDNNNSRNKKTSQSIQDTQFYEKLEKMNEEFEKKYPQIANFHEKLRKNPHILEEITIGNWNLSNEEE